MKPTNPFLIHKLNTYSHLSRYSMDRYSLISNSYSCLLELNGLIFKTMKIRFGV